MAKIEFDGVSFGYEKNVEVLNNISFCIEKGETVGIVGANGVGKSTLLKLMLGLLGGYAGNIRIDGMKLEGKNYPAIRKKLGYVFQDSDNQLFMSTVYEDIAFGPRNYGYSKGEVEERVKEAMALTHTDALGDKQVHKLSGGEKKLVSIATVLSLMPDVLLMDEPTISLDPKNRRNLIRILNTFSCTRIMASHDLDFVLDTCQRTILMSHGCIVFDGPTKDVLTDRQLLEENNLELPLSMSKL